jgi:elongation factor G
MGTFTTNFIRNVVLLGHSGSGKTTFTESMLFESKAINRRGNVQDKTTTSDYTALEQQRGASIFSTLEHAFWKDTKLNIMDAPGADDFAAEVVCAMKVADTAVVMLNARAGVEVGTELVWEYIERFRTPAFFVINQIDHEKADFEMTLEQARTRFGTRVLPVQYPLNSGAGFNKIIDALRMVMYVFSADGGKPKKEPIPATEMFRAQAMHDALVEAAAENDEGLMEKFFESGNLSEDELAKGLKIGLAHQQFFPVFCASAAKNMGSGRIMGFIHDVCPNPSERPAAELESGGTKPCDSNAKPTVFIWKTVNEPRVGVLSYFKIYAGTLRSGDELVNATNGNSERFAQIYITEGKNRAPVEELKAGDIGCTVKLKGSHTNQTLNAKGSEIQVKKIEFPNPRIRVAVHPPNKNDIEKLARALHSIHEEDPTVILEQSAELRQTILHAQGELHLEIIKQKAKENFDVELIFEKPRIPYRETITKMANKDYRHKKQSGGAGQFAEIHFRIEPWYAGMPNPAELNVKSIEEEDLPWGGKFVFCWCIVGGSIDARFISAIKKGIYQKLESGPVTGSACRDIRVSVYDGKMHAVDSNDMAFQLAAMMGFREVFHLCAPQVMEPIYNLEVMCAGEVMGDVMGDLQTRRAIIVGMDSDGHYQIVKARVPLAELYKYSSALRALTQGKAKFSMDFAEYSPVSTEIQRRLAEAYEKEHEAEMAAHH